MLHAGSGSARSRRRWALGHGASIGQAGSELELKGYRGRRMAQKIQARLGGDRSGFEFPEKINQRAIQDVRVVGEQAEIDLMLQVPEANIVGPQK
jgi:hypothetical protein